MDTTTNEAFAKITSEATRDAMLAKQEHEIAAQRDRVEYLENQVRDRISHLRSTLYEVESNLSRFPYGAVLRDGKTLDELLAALAHEGTRLRDLEAASSAALRLSEKYQAEVDGVDLDGLTQSAPVSAGQYL